MVYTLKEQFARSYLANIIALSNAIDCMTDRFAAAAAVRMS